MDIINTNMDSLKLNGEDKELKFGSRAMSLIEKELGKPIIQLGEKTAVDGQLSGVVYELDVVAVCIKHGCGVTIEQAYDIMDENEGSMLTVMEKLMKSYVAKITVAQSGNSNGPEMSNS